MLDTDPTARVGDLEHDLADLDEVELLLEPHQNGGLASITEDEATAAVAAALKLRTEVAPEEADTIGGYIIARRREFAAEVGTALN